MCQPKGPRKSPRVSDPGEFKLAWGSIAQDGRMIADCPDRIVSGSKQEADLANHTPISVQIKRTQPKQLPRSNKINKDP